MLRQRSFANAGKNRFSYAAVHEENPRSTSWPQPRGNTLGKENADDVIIGIDSSSKTGSGKNCLRYSAVTKRGGRARAET